MESRVRDRNSLKADKRGITPISEKGVHRVRLRSTVGRIVLVLQSSEY